MRKAAYSCKRVICPNASLIGDSTRIAKPGHWIVWRDGEAWRVGRVMGRIEKNDGPNYYAGHIVAMCLSTDLESAGIRWVNPADVTHCSESAPAQMLAWISGPEWVKNKKDIARLIAMAQHGTTSERYIGTRNDADKPYNSRPEYAAQWVMGE